MGFCYFNNIAIAARHLKNHHHLERIAIIDWDVHHGNGTQHSFEEDANIFYFSIHQYGNLFFPGTGGPTEQGVGPGKGFTLNAPVPPGQGDGDYQKIII